jgi:hypothetical protein
LLRRPALKLLRSSTTTLSQKNRQEKICGIRERDGIAAAQKRTFPARRQGRKEKAEQNQRLEEGERQEEEATRGRKSWVGLLAADLSLSGAESSTVGNAYKNLQKCERSVKTTWDCPKELVESYRRGESLG